MATALRVRAATRAAARAVVTARAATRATAVATARVATAQAPTAAGTARAAAACKTAAGPSLWAGPVASSRPPSSTAWWAARGGTSQLLARMCRARMRHLRAVPRRRRRRSHRMAGSWAPMPAPRHAVQAPTAAQPERPAAVVRRRVRRACALWTALPRRRWVWLRPQTTQPRRRCLRRARRVCKQHGSRATLAAPRRRRPQTAATWARRRTMMCPTARTAWCGGGRTHGRRLGSLRLTPLLSGAR
mmetsp:Transcript_2941/g.7962  ORF Transcript_2941/g.7962 Transcript_2941/m.7962 type:complete len:246 (+) Transcript_2941:750-1487(+)